MTGTQQIQWKRIGIEAIAIVASILVNKQVFVRIAHLLRKIEVW
jgi:hypothetical protein